MIDLSFVKPSMLDLTRKEANVKHFVEKKLNAQVFEHAFVLPVRNIWNECKCPGGVVTEDRKFIMSSAWFESLRCNKYDFDENEAVRSNQCVVYMGIMHTCWGHAITDNLKKLWFLKTEAYQELVAQGAKTIFLTIENDNLPEYIYELFDLCNVEFRSFTRISEITQFDKVIVPDNSFITEAGERNYTSAYLDTISEIKSHIVKTLVCDKVYFTRTGFRSSRDMGERSIERVFRKMGYQFFSPEKLDMMDQLSLLAHCKSFAATEGSVSHNVIFCKPETQVTVLRKVDDVNKYQLALSEAAEVNLTLVDAHCSTKAIKQSLWYGPFYMCVTKELCKFAHLYWHVPVFLLPTYWWYCIWNCIWNSDFVIRNIKYRKIIKRLFKFFGYIY